MTAQRGFRLIIVVALAILLAWVGAAIGTWIASWWTGLAGSTVLVTVAAMILVLCTLALVLTLPAIIQFIRCGLIHTVPLVRQAWPAFSLLALSLAAFSASRSRTLPPEVRCITEKIEAGENSLVTDKKEVATDLIFDFNQSETYSPLHEQKMDKYLTDLFSDYDEIEVSKIVARTDPIGSEQSNLDLARRRGDYIKRAIERVARSSTLASRFNASAPPLIAVVAEGPSADDRAYWQTCFKRFHASQQLFDRPLKPLHASLSGNRPSCDAVIPEAGKDGVYPACRRLVPSDVAKRSSAAAFAPRMENFRELTACLAPMRHAVIYFNRARLISVPAEPTASGVSTEVPCPPKAS